MLELRTRIKLPGVNNNFLYSNNSALVVVSRILPTHHSIPYLTRILFQLQ